MVCVGVNQDWSKSGVKQRGSSVSWHSTVYPGWHNPSQLSLCHSLSWKEEKALKNEDKGGLRAMEFSIDGRHQS